MRFATSPLLSKCWLIVARYRLLGTGSEWQSMAAFDYTISARGVECENYIPMYRTVATDSTVHNASNKGPAL